MKIKIEIDKNILKDINKSVNYLLKIKSNEMELTEENLKEIKKIKEMVRVITTKCWNIENTKIVNYDGTELTKLI